MAEKYFENPSVHGYVCVQLLDVVLWLYVGSSKRKTDTVSPATRQRPTLTDRWISVTSRKITSTQLNGLDY